MLAARHDDDEDMRENSYASVAQRADTTNLDNKYRSLVKKFIYLEAND